MTELAPLSRIQKAQQAVANVETLPDALRLRAQMLVMDQMLDKIGTSLGEQNDLAEQRLILERKIGDWLAETGLNQPGRPRKLDIVSSFASKSYKDFDIENKDAQRFQLEAEVPQERFETYITTTRERGAEITSAGLIRIAKELRREQKREGNRDLVEQATPIREYVAGERFETIVLDPPWDWGDEGDQDQLGRARPTYATLSIDQLLDWPVPDLTADNAHIYLWITNRSLPKGFALLERWGFRYVTCLTWVKPSFGMGNYFRGSTEQVLFGVKGALELLRKDVGTHFEAPREGEHSTKPAAFYELVETCSPGPWLEVFSRHDRSNWVTFGEASGL